MEATADVETTLDDLMRQPHWMMFLPGTARDAMSEFPELNKVDAFTKLIGKPQKFMFVLFYANRMSDAMRLHDDKDRIRFALHMAYGEDVPKEVEKNYLNQRWGDEVSAAIRAMRGFDPLPRMLMKMTCLVLMKRVKRLLDQAPPTAGDWKATGEYFNTIKNGMALMQELQPFTEHNAFGIVERTREQLREPGAMMERLHNKRS